MRRQIPSLQRGFGDLKTEIPSLQRGFGDLKTEIPSLQRGFGDLKTEIPSLQRGFGDLKTEIPSLQRGFGDLKTEIPSLQRGFGDLKTEIPSLQRGFGDLKTEIPSLQRGVADLTSSMGRRLSNVETFMSGLAQWPGGFYALLQPKTGCPVDLAFFGGTHKFHRLHTEGGDGHSSAPGRHVAFHSGSNKFIPLEFCEVTKQFKTEGWPQGSFSVNRFTSLVLQDSLMAMPILTQKIRDL